MTADTAANLLLIAAAVVWILAKQVRTERVKPRLLVLAPLLLAYFGVRGIAPTLWHDTADSGLLALSAAVSAALGVWRGRTIAVWQDADGVWWRRGSRLTVALWGALFAVRSALYVLDLAVGHPEASGLGALLCTLAVGFAAQNAVIGARTIAPAARIGDRMTARR